MASSNNPLRYQPDFDWLINSPELLDCSVAGSHMGVEMLDAQRLLPSNYALSDHFSPEFKRLGIYFEKLVLEGLRVNSTYDLIQSNYQVRADGLTLGEYDAILKDVIDDTTVHLEIAVKFYLLLNDGKQLSDWVGPGLHDRLDLKYQRMMTHQLMLGEKAIAAGLNTLPYIPADHKSLLTRGRLYYPYQSYIEQQFIFPEEINSAHLKGFWMPKREFIELRADKPNTQWYDLAKPYWLAEISDTDLEQLRPFDVDALKGAKQVVAISDNRELMRGFVVTEEWLDQSKYADQIT